MSLLPRLGERARGKPDRPDPPAAPRVVHPIDSFVGQRIRTLRVERRLSQTAVAGKLGLTFQQLQKYEKGANRISASKLFQIAEVLGVAVADLFDGVAGSFGDAGDSPNGPPFRSKVDLLVAAELSRIDDKLIKRRLLALVAALVPVAKKQDSSESE